jgi:hypothetical protein
MGVPLLGFVFNRSSSKVSRYDAYRPNDPRISPSFSSAKETRS